MLCITFWFKHLQSNLIFYRQSLTLVMTTLIHGFSQYVINILLPSCHPMSRILLSSVIDQFAMVLETLEIQHHYQLEMIEIKKNSPDVFQVVPVFPVDRDKPWFHGHHGLVYLILTDFSFIIIIYLKLKYNAFTIG